MGSTTSFEQLTPDFVLEATEEAGFQPTGQFTQLNSYENRVFDIRIEPTEHKGQTIDRVVAKFYRPGRWDQATILEEHEFLFDLENEGIPVVSPLLIKPKQSLMKLGPYWSAFFPRFMGKMPDELFDSDLGQIGRRLAQIHTVGSQKKFKHRPTLLRPPFSASDHLDVLQNWVAPELWDRYQEAGEMISERLQDLTNGENFLRIHGDCHRGNLLVKPQQLGHEFFFVDFDDCVMGPEIQDFWMLFRDFSEDEKNLLLSGYEDLREFPHEQWNWVPWLRGFRILSYSAWIARRWDDPSFRQIFPHFESFTFWAEETEALERIAWERPST